MKLPEKRLSAVLAGALAVIFGVSSAGPTMAYPGPDGYDSGWCYPYTGVKMGLSNWKSGTGQVVAVDVDDNSTKVNLARVRWESSLGTFIVTTGTARVEIYRANATEKPWITAITTNGSSCSKHLDGDM